MIDDTSQPASDISQRSAALRELYSELAENEEARALNAETIRLTAEEARFAASQWVMIWRRFRRNKAAIVGGVIVLLYYIGAILANFIGPYALDTRFIEQAYLPPQHLHFFSSL